MRLPLAEGLLVATLAPLVLLTGGAWVRWGATWLQTPGVSEEDKKLLTEADSAGNATALHRAQVDELGARKFSRSQFSATPPVATNDQFTDAAALWQARVDVAQAAMSFPTKPHENWRGGGREAVAAALRHLKSGQGNPVADRVVGRLESAIAAITDTWAKQAEEYERTRGLRDRLQVLLDNAERNLEEPDQCRRILDEAKPLVDVDVAKYKPRWEALSLRCEFYAGFKSLRLSEFSANQTRLVRAFVERYGRGAGLTDAELPLLERARRRKTENEQRELIEQAFRQPTDDPAKLAEQLRSLPVDELLDGPRGDLRKNVRGWMLERVPELKVPADWKKKVGDEEVELRQAELRQAEQKNATLLVGVWRPGDAANSFKYWVSIASFVIDQKGGVTYQAGVEGKFGIQAEPVRWVGLGWYEDYNATRAKVAARPAARDPWASFADECERLAKAIEAHEKKYGKPKATWDFPFATRAQFARALLETSTWDVIRRCAE